MIEFRNLTRKPIPRTIFKKLYQKIFRGKRLEVSVVFAPPALMRKLNKTYRKKDKAANVLSFLLEQGSPDARRMGSGEIFLNVQEPDLPRLFVHGCLHLLGYDHKQEKDAQKMEALERRFLNK